MLADPLVAERPGLAQAIVAADEAGLAAIRRLCVIHRVCTERRAQQPPPWRPRFGT